MILKAVGEAEMQKFRMQRSLNYELASLVRVGFHNPNKFPKHDKFMGEKRREAKSDDLHDYLLALSLRPSAQPKPKQDI